MRETARTVSPPERQGHWRKGTRQKQTQIQGKQNRPEVGFKPLNRSIPSPLPQMLTDLAHRANIPKVAFKELSNICVGLYTSHKGFCLPTTLPIKRVVSLSTVFRVGLRLVGISERSASPFSLPEGTHRKHEVYKKGLYVLINTYTHVHTEDPNTLLPSSGAGFMDRI